MNEDDKPTISDVIGDVCPDLLEKVSPEMLEKLGAEAVELGADDVASMVVLEGLTDCAEALRGKVTTAEFAEGVALFAATFAFGSAPSPMHATRLLLRALDAVLHEEADGFDAYNENDENDEDTDGKDGENG